MENLKVWNSSHMYAFLIIHINTHANVDCYVANKYLSNAYLWAKHCAGKKSIVYDMIDTFLGHKEPAA